MLIKFDFVNFNKNNDLRKGSAPPCKPMIISSYIVLFICENSITTIYLIQDQILCVQSLNRIHCSKNSSKRSNIFLASKLCLLSLNERNAIVLIYILDESKF